MRNRAGTIVKLDLQVSDATGPHDGEPVLLMLATPSQDRTQRAFRDEQTTAAFGQLAALLLAPRPHSVQAALELSAAILGADATVLYRAHPRAPGLQLIAAHKLPGTFPLELDPADEAATATPIKWAATSHPSSAITRAARDAGLGAIITHPLGDASAISGLLVAAYRKFESAPADAASLARIVANSLHALIASLVRAHAVDLQRTQSESIQLYLEALLDYSNDGIVMVDGGGRITQINRAAERMLGYAAHEVVGSKVNDVVVDSNPKSGDIDTLLQSSQQSAQEIALVRRDGQVLAALVRAVALPAATDTDAAGSGLLVISDRTEYKTFEAQSERLKQSAFLGDMSAIFAHEVRNPLNGISTGLQYLAMQAGPEDPLQDDLDKMMDEVKRIEGLLTSTLQIARPREMHLQPTDVRDVFERLLIRRGPRMERRQIEFSVHQTDPNLLAMADPNLLEHVFDNLISNAMEAIGPEGGAITVNISRWSGDRPQFGDYVRIEVGDSGPGITPEAAARVFDLFFTTKDDGTGLGLALARRIVQAHRGTIDVESWPGVGTRFIIGLPTANNNQTPSEDAIPISGDR